MVDMVVVDVVSMMNDDGRRWSMIQIPFPDRASFHKCLEPYPYRWKDRRLYPAGAPVRRGRLPFWE
jgi:hypothetical protein